MTVQRTLIPFLAAIPLTGGCAPPATACRGQSVRQQVKAPAAKRPDAPQLTKTGNGRYQVRKPWTVEIGGMVWRVPAGYSCNGITAPERLKVTLGDGIDQPETWAAVFHDWLFTQKGVSRAEADRTFHQLLLAYGVPSGKAALMHTVVSGYSLSKSFR